MARLALPLLLLLASFVAGLAFALAASPVHASGAGVVGVDEDDELGLGGGAGGVTRRWLQDVSNATDPANATDSTTTGFISLDALRANAVPCLLNGPSYYNCRPGAEANPYQRACSTITQCRD